MKKQKSIISIILAVIMIFSISNAALVAFASDEENIAEFSGHKYERIDTSMTWKDAEAYCEKNGGYLATITTLQEQLLIQSIVEKGTKLQYWLGGTDEETEGEWKWVTGEDWSFWADTITFDNSKGSENYLQMQRVNKNVKDNLKYAWNDANNENFIEGEEDYFSTEMTGFVCEYGDEPIIDDGSVEYLGHKYLRLEESMTWKDAKIFCENQGGYLATITSEQEQNIVRLLVKNGEKAQYWLGGTDEGHVGQWTWVTGEQFNYFAQTISFESNDTERQEYFLQMQRHNWGNKSALGKWNNANNENHIEGEESFYSTEMVGLICEIGTSEMPNEDMRTEPIVYVIGRTGIYTADGEPTITENTSFITDIVENNMDALKDAVLKGKWDAYCDVIYEQIAEEYSDYRLSDEGEVVDGSHVKFKWDANSIPNLQWDMFTYKYEYDARLDPCDIADDLNNYIEAIKAKTGYEKVHLVSRCLGCNIASAYLSEYGWDSIDTNVMYASAAKGYDFVGEMFAGKFAFSSSAVARYEDETYTGDDGDSEETIELVKSIIELIDEKGILSLGTLTADAVFSIVCDKIVPRLLIATYGTCPGYWAMVNDENFEQAKQFVFGDDVNGKYATLVKKIDDYHYNVQTNLEDTLLKMKADGVKMNVICKYGFQVSPFIESSDALGDNRIDVTKQSLGATTAKINRTFTPIYMSKAEKNGTAKYISVDRQIDGSTALFPDSTWYIKNNLHNPFYDCFNPLLKEMCYSEEQMTIDSDENWPAYLYYNDSNSTCAPLTEENMNSTKYSTKYTTNIFEAYYRFIKAFFEFIIDRISQWGK